MWIRIAEICIIWGELDPDPDPHQSEKSDPKALQPAGRCGAHNRAMEAHLGAAVANNGTKDAHSGVLEGLQASGSDTQHFDEEPDSHRCKRSDTDPHQSEKSDLDPHQS